mmetsp:Transcript_14096/g.32860  ORF Transcript_14096/g.32860 Transcript_14096/m.32860 type:complete len:300 (-) Transcript_14096:2383-3282(-)
MELRLNSLGAFADSTANGACENPHLGPQLWMQVPPLVSQLWHGAQAFQANHTSLVLRDIHGGFGWEVGGVDGSCEVLHQFQRSQNRVLEPSRNEGVKRRVHVGVVIRGRPVHDRVNAWKIVRRARIDVEVAAVDNVRVAEAEDPCVGERVAPQFEGVISGQTVPVGCSRYQLDCKEGAVAPPVGLVDQRRDVGDIVQVPEWQCHPENAQEREQHVDSPVHGWPQIQRSALVESGAQRSELVRKVLVGLLHHCASRRGHVVVVEENPQQADKAQREHHHERWERDARQSNVLFDVRQAGL